MLLPVSYTGLMVALLGRNI